jgi:endonuclease/exonuclease/phosphatase (EEP) superfamily protein YafD
MPPRFPVRAQAFLTGSVGVALLSPLLAIGAADLSGVDHRWFDLAAQFSAPATVGALVLTTLFALLRWRGPILAGALTAAICAFAAAPQAFPRLAKAESGAPEMRLYSANLWVGNADVEAIRESVRRAQPDLVILIEAGDAPAQAIDEIVPDLPHRVSSPRRQWRGRGERTIIASRWPLGPLKLERDVVAETPLGPIHLTAVHLTRPWPYQVQWEQIREMDRLVEDSMGPGVTRVIAGDFNSVTDARIGRQMARDSGLIPAPAFPGTWPAQLPSPLGIGIDNVWVSRDLTVTRRSLGVRNGSDHRPVVTVLTRARR